MHFAEELALHFLKTFGSAKHKAGKFSEDIASGSSGVIPAAVN